MKIRLPILRLVLAALTGVLWMQTLEAREYLDTLAVFTGDNGAYPANIMQTLDGDIYGVTYGGGKYDDGTIFKIPFDKPLETVVHFNRANGANPCSRLIQTDRNTFYGTTCNGGAAGKGTVFQFSSEGKFKTLASFYGPNGANPEADLLAMPDGTIYGCTYAGGDHDLGTLFILTPDHPLKTVVNFTGQNGSHPLGLALGLNGTIYGITGSGGIGNQGTIFMLTSANALTTLHSFTEPGSVSPGSHISMLDGNLYETTSHGGRYNLGGIYAISPDGMVSPVASFDGAAGMHPGSDIVQWHNGYFYMERLWDNMRIKAAWIQWSGLNFCGTTTDGGDHGNGTIYLVNSMGVATTLASFTGTEGQELGSNPNSLIAGLDGNLYGTTSHGGKVNKGTIFRLQIQIWPFLEQATSYSVGSLRPPIVSP